MKLTSKEDTDIKNLYLNECLSSTEIAKIFNVSHRTILNHLKKWV